MSSLRGYYHQKSSIKTPKPTEILDTVHDRLLGVCAVQSRRFLVGANPTRQMLQPEATGATVEVTKRLKPSGDACHDIR